MAIFCGADVSFLIDSRMEIATIFKIKSRLIRSENLYPIELSGGVGVRLPSRSSDFFSSLVLDC